jgi:hypothetical protein
LAGHVLGLSAEFVRHSLQDNRALIAGKAWDDEGSVAKQKPSLSGSVTKAQCRSD